jgi:SAM-dependent methyltransferase
VITLTPTPPANAFVPADRADEDQACFPLEVYFCESCAHVQLRDVVDPRILFEEYVYVSGTSPVFVRHLQGQAEDVVSRFGFGKRDLVVEIGSNDGTLLKAFRELGFDVLGIDPATDIAARATADGIETWPDFFSPDLAARIKMDRGSARVIAANNVFAHIDDLAAVADGISNLLADDGVFVFEVSYLLDVFEQTLFDTIYHEHLAYHSVAPLRMFFASHGLHLFDVERVSAHGGSLRGFVQKSGGPHTESSSVENLIALEHTAGIDQTASFHEFGARLEALKAELTGLLRRLKAEGNSIIGFGAPAKATTLMYYFELGSDVIDVIVDEGPLKLGLLTPGLHVPVVSSDALYDRNPDYVLILAWNFADPIIEKHARYSDQGGQFIVPLPRLELRP